MQLCCYILREAITYPLFLNPVDEVLKIRVVSILYNHSLQLCFYLVFYLSDTTQCEMTTTACVAYVEHYTAHKSIKHNVSYIIFKTYKINLKHWTTQLAPVTFICCRKRFQRQNIWCNKNTVDKNHDKMYAPKTKIDQEYTNLPSLYTQRSQLQLQVHRRI